MSTHTSSMMRRFAASPAGAVQALNRTTSTSLGRRAGAPYVSVLRKQSAQAALPRGKQDEASSHNRSATAPGRRLPPAVSSTFTTMREFTAVPLVKQSDEDHDDLEGHMGDVELKQGKRASAGRKKKETAESAGTRDDSGSADIGPPPGTPSPGKGRNVHEMWAQMEYESKGSNGESKPVSKQKLQKLLGRVKKQEHLEYATAAMRLYRKSQTLDFVLVNQFVKRTCELGRPLVALKEVQRLPKELVAIRTFNYLVTELYIGGYTKELDEIVEKARAESPNPERKRDDILFHLSGEEEHFRQRRIEAGAWPLRRIPFKPLQQRDPLEKKEMKERGEGRDKKSYWPPWVREWWAKKAAQAKELEAATPVAKDGSDESAEQEDESASPEASPVEDATDRERGGEEEDVADEAHPAEKVEAAATKVEAGDTEIAEEEGASASSEAATVEDTPNEQGDVEKEAGDQEGVSGEAQQDATKDDTGDAGKQ